MNSDHLQFGEALEWLREELAFAIVDPNTSSGCEVRVNRNDRFEYTIDSTSVDEPSTALTRLVKARGFTVERVESRYRFGPKTGQTFTFYRISRRLTELEAAVRETIELFLLLSDRPRSEWLWITNENYDDREEPKPPTSWPTVT